jgi:hypothetical protein
MAEYVVDRLVLHGGRLADWRVNVTEGLVPLPHIAGKA